MLSTSFFSLYIIIITKCIMMYIDFCRFIRLSCPFSGVLILFLGHQFCVPLFVPDWFKLHRFERSYNAIGRLFTLNKEKEAHTTCLYTGIVSSKKSQRIWNLLFWMQKKLCNTCVIRQYFIHRNIFTHVLIFEILKTKWKCIPYYTVCFLILSIFVCVNLQAEYID